MTEIDHIEELKKKQKKEDFHFFVSAVFFILYAILVYWVWESIKDFMAFAGFILIPMAVAFLYENHKAEKDKKLAEAIEMSLIKEVGTKKALEIFRKHIEASKNQS